jgi:hypothetical protein
MNRQRAIELLLADKDIQHFYAPGTWASYKHKLTKGTMKAKTTFELLTKHGYRLLSDEAWEPPGDKEREFVILYVKDRTFKIRTVMCMQTGQAISEIISSVKESACHTDITGWDAKKITKIVNEIISGEYVLNIDEDANLADIDKTKV